MHFIYSNFSLNSAMETTIITNNWLVHNSYTLTMMQPTYSEQYIFYKLLDIFYYCSCAMLGVNATNNDVLHRVDSIHNSLLLYCIRSSYCIALQEKPQEVEILFVIYILYQSPPQHLVILLLVQFFVAVVFHGNGEQFDMQAFQHCVGGWN